MERRAPARERAALARLEQHVEAALAAQVRVEVRGQQRAGQVAAAADRPVVAQLDQQQVAVGTRAGARRLVDPDELAAAAQVELVAEERHRAQHEVALVAPGRVVAGGDGHVLGLAFEDRLGLGERGAALPELRDPRVARRRSATPGRNRCRRRACPGRPSPPGSWPRAAKKPSFTNARAPRSNSRTTEASAPPRESETRHAGSRASGIGRPARPSSPTRRPTSASTSITVSQTGAALRYSASVVRRHRPRGLRASRQKL